MNPPDNHKNQDSSGIQPLENASGNPKHNEVFSSGVMVLVP